MTDRPAEQRATIRSGFAFIVATALVLGEPLVTLDRRIADSGVVRVIF